MAKKEIEQTEIEAPYELPEGWKWCRLGEVADWGSGGTPSRKNPKYYQGSIPWIKTGELNETYIFDSEEKVSEDAIKHSSAKIFPKETVVMAMYGATIGKTAIFGIDASTNQACACAICHKELDNHFLFNFLKSKKDYFLYNAKGGAQPNISQEIIKNTPIPLPPTLAEQQRIVNRIESMFAKLDEAKEKAQNVIDGFETRKAAILHKAFTGELTAKWRKENNPEKASDYLEKIKDKVEIRLDFKYWENTKLPESWCESTIGNLLYFAGRVGWKGLKAEEYTSEGPILLSVYNLNDGDEVSFNKINHITNERYDESPEIMVRKNDILLTKDGAGIGKLGYVNELPEKATINSSLLLIRPGDVANYKFIFYLLSGPALQNIVKERITGSATPHLFQRDIKEFVLPVPSLPEQQEIVRILDTVLEKESRAKEAAGAVLDQIALLKKSILARAFRGEL